MMRTILKIVIFVGLIGCLWLLVEVVNRFKAMTAGTQCAYIVHEVVVSIQRGNAFDAALVTNIVGNITSSNTGLMRRNERGEFIDPWHHPITVTSQCSTNRIELEVRSAGRDGVLLTGDDLGQRIVITTNARGAVDIQGAAFERIKR
jgi:hypothetical protein